MVNCGLSEKLWRRLDAGEFREIANELYGPDCHHYYDGRHVWKTDWQKDVVEEHSDGSITVQYRCECGQKARQRFVPGEMEIV